MHALADLSLKQAYHKPEDDIARAFYLPCLAAARTYDRAVGYFSSAVYALAWPSLKEFVDNGGHIRLICSPVLAPDDASAMVDGYAARDEGVQGELLKNEFLRLISTPGLIKPAKVLASLVALGVVDFRIAWVGEVGGPPRRLFHDKVGIFRDANGNAVAFKGSMNETWPGLALDGNLESVDVFVSWADDRERARVDDEQEYFDRLWANDFPEVTTVPLPQVAREQLIAASDPEHWGELVDEICIEIEAASRWSPEPERQGRVPRPHQVSALEAWQQQGRRGIFEHATGSGKTFTALCAIMDAFERDETVLVLVPSDLLLRQWTSELRSTFDTLGLRLLICGGGHVDWKTDGLLAAWTRATTSGTPRAVIATLQTASSSEFIDACRGGEHLFLVADEVHRLGAIGARRVFELASGPRLGLSATPHRAGDQPGTDAILGYFHGVVPPPFTLFDAINAGTLTRYAYHVHRIRLDQDEQERWDRLSQDIRKLFAQMQGASAPSPESQLRFAQLLIRRARIVKGAGQKSQAAVDVVTSSYQPGQHWIVYCDDQGQLTQVRDALSAAGCSDVLEYHSAMAGDPRQTLALFERRGGVVVSIRCLDEGVDIPAVSHALILASSKNPREYIQRRGRVLRRSPGKFVSHIHDVLVTPLFDPDAPPSTAILEGELARAIEFGSNALNPGAITDLQRLAIEHGIDWARFGGIGVEDDENESSGAHHD
jgi:superfamily II DNA or RNA helicase